jgi:hypothetical protein
MIVPNLNNLRFAEKKLGLPILISFKVMFMTEGELHCFISKSNEVSKSNDCLSWTVSTDPKADHCFHKGLSVTYPRIYPLT